MPEKPQFYDLQQQLHQRAPDDPVPPITWVLANNRPGALDTCYRRTPNLQLVEAVKAEQRELGQPSTRNASILFAVGATSFTGSIIASREIKDHNRKINAYHHKTATEQAVEQPPTTPFYAHEVPATVMAVAGVSLIAGGFIAKRRWRMRAHRIAQVKATEAYTEASARMDAEE